MIELEQALEAIRTLREFCKQTSVGDCAADMCPVSRWCRDIHLHTKTPEEWTVRGEQE